MVARYAFVFRRRLLVTLLLLHQLLQASNTAYCCTVDGADVKMVVDEKVDAFATFALFRLQELYECRETHLAEGQSVFVGTVKLCDIVLLHMLRLLDIAERTQIITVLVIERLSALDEEEAAFAGEAICDGLDEAVHEKWPQDPAQLRLVDVQDAINPGLDDTVGFVPSSAFELVVEGDRLAGCVKSDVSAFSPKHRLRTTVAFLGKVLEHLLCTWSAQVAAVNRNSLMIASARWKRDSRAHHQCLADTF